MIAPANPSPHAPPPAGPRDRLTIARMLVLTAGLAVGLGVFAPKVGRPPAVGDVNWWLALANAVLIGLALPAPLFIVRPRRREQTPLGFGALFALVAGLGALSMLPPALVERLKSGQSGAAACLAYVLPLMGLWFMLAALVTGQIRLLFRADTPWTERYGAVLALLWSPFGVWHLYNFYAEALR